MTILLWLISFRMEKGACGEFDFIFQPKLDRQKVMSLFDLTFIQYKQNVIFLGPPGVGK
ncbi:MAG TPA: ATP-binding protein, partial [Candidatus Marinimicrobia bacterium]|nr:ATP-binding protein [Candidatus Neomarinimicrobiota bacterium]